MHGHGIQTPPLCRSCFSIVQGSQIPFLLSVVVLILMLCLLPAGAGAKAPASVGPPPILETSHQFAEYTYKNITSCDVCSQIMKGNTRQGLKCKLCRMNVHSECQDKVVKCQPKAKFSRMKSGSEMGDDESKISFYVTEQFFEVLSLDLNLDVGFFLFQDCLPGVQSDQIKEGKTL